ncbi:hypothetical protein Dimus_030234, partial [Dionaea muscipula]
MYAIVDPGRKVYSKRSSMKNNEKGSSFLLDILSKKTLGTGDAGEIGMNCFHYFGSHLKE